MNQHALHRFAFVSILMLSAMSLAQQPAPAPTPEMPKDTITRIFTGEFSERPSPPPRWFDGGQSYIAMEPAAGGNGRDVVKYDTATGKNREVLITAAQLTPEGAKEALQIAGLSWSKDNQRVLIFTNTRRVWRTNSRGDYWFLDRRSGKLKKLGGDAPEASLMYAKFNPDASRVAYVKSNDIYVEDLASGKIQRITHDGSDLVINGGSDWVNEEELDLHDCFRWSPDGKRIAFWQFDLHGVGDFALMYYLGKEREVVTDIPYPHTGPYPVEMQVPYPLAGTTNSAVRAGVVNANGKGRAKWMDVPGDPRQNYIARMQWADANTLLVQQLNRLQNTDNYLLADASSGAVHQMWRMSVAPVPDQRLYDSIYQERYMGLPQDNVNGYKQGSAINFAAGLKGHLLIVHGSGDDNVHYQGTELLVNRLIELGKPFDFMTYPDRTHGIFEGPGTTVHLYHLLARYLTEHLPAGPQ